LQRLDIKNLPEDGSELRSIIFTLISESNSLSAKNNLLFKEKQLLLKEKNLLNKKTYELLERISYLEEQLRKFLHKKFGASSEKVTKQISNLEHQLEETEISLGLDISPITEKKDSKKCQAKREQIPEHIAREEVILEAPKKCCECGSISLRKIGEDTSEVLEYVPASFKAIKYIRPRMVCKECDHMNQSYPVSKVIDKGKVGSGLLAHIMVQKYCNHLPLYRQSQIYERESSIKIARSTMGSWLG